MQALPRLPGDLPASNHHDQEPRFSIVVVVLMTAAFARKVSANATRWDDAGQRPGGARAFAFATLLLWLAIVVFGRFIGYTWFYYVIHAATSRHTA